MTDVERCQVLVPDGGRMVTVHVCGRPVKRDGMCGVHAAAKERAAANESAWRIRGQEDRALEEGVIAALAELGIPGDPDYSLLHHRYSGKAVVEIEDLREALRAAEAAGFQNGLQARPGTAGN